ncbi:MAG TPA: hypothetical protein PKC03_12055 [Dokdonella sp.]|nr:hypothetical protein [Dokdonella sp.]
MHGGLLATWWIFCAWCLSLGAQRAWGLVPLDADAGYQLFPIDRIVVGAAQALGLACIGSISSAALSLLLLGLVGGYTCSAIGQLLRIDQHRLSRRALLDTTRQIGNALAWMAPVAMLLLVMALLYSDGQPAWLTPAMWAIGLLLVLLAPFLVLDHALLSGPGSRRWHVGWPGWGALGTAIAALIAYVAIDLVTQLAFLSGGITAQILLSPLRWILDAAFWALFCAAWVDRRSIRDLWTQRGVVLTGSRLGSFIALDIRLGVLVLWLMPVAYGILLNLVFVLPQIIHMIEQDGSDIPLSIKWLLTWRGNLFIPVFALSPLIVFAHGRLYVLLNESEGMPQNDATS